MCEYRTEEERRIKFLDLSDRREYKKKKCEQAMKERCELCLNIYFLVFVPHSRHWLSVLFIEQGDNLDTTR
jgi:hypothetical protein